jgi:hypothetical protein
MMKYVLVVALAAAMVFSPACADVNFGAYARTAGMGGAGLAVVGDPVTSGSVNPAAYAFKGSRFRMMLPSADFRMQGTSLSQIRRDIQDATDDEDSAIDLAKRLGRQDTTAELAGLAGVSVGPIVLSIDGQASMKLQPGEGFKSWANSESVSPADLSKYNSNTAIMDALAIGDYEPLADALRADGYYSDLNAVAFVALPSVGFGISVPKNPNWNIGIRAKMLKSRAVFERITPTVDSVELSGDSLTAIGLDFYTDDSVAIDTDDSGLGVDLGVIYTVPDSDIHLTTALVMNNIVKPNLEGVGLQRMFSVGAAASLRDNVVVAADLVNINRACNQSMKLRVGAEVSPVRWLAVRAGYGGGSFTCGLGLSGFNIAISSNMPTVVGRVWSF